ncbi:NAD(P)-binding protein [Biscogniauxia mediterranea]|nr:NAD(P)-binding protein [Biscogniauxia mediterranea]
MAASTKPYNLPSDAVWLTRGLPCSQRTHISNRLLLRHRRRPRQVPRDPSALTADLIPDGPGVLKARLDVTSGASIDAALARFGRVDVLVNDAGARCRPCAATPPAPPSSFVSSFGGFCAAPGSAFYHASKFALEGFAESLAKELHPDWGIHVCCLEPGGVRTRFLGSSFRLMERRHPEYGGDHMPTNVNLKMMEDPDIAESFGTPEQVARAVWAMMSAGKRLPMRLPLGTDAWAMVSGELDAVRGELEEWKDVSRSVGNQKGLERIEVLKKIA